MGNGRLTKCLDSHVHLGLGGVGDGVGAELDVGAGRRLTTAGQGGEAGMGRTYFFMIMYLRAFPRVWVSLRNSNEAAVGVEPGSWCHECEPTRSIPS